MKSKKPNRKKFYEPESRHWKVGDVNPDTGLVFYRYCKTIPGGIDWVTAEKLAAIKAKRNAEKRHRIATDTEYAEKERSYLRKKRQTEEFREHEKSYRERFFSDPVNRVKVNLRAREKSADKADRARVKHAEWMKATNYNKRRREDPVEKERERSRSLIRGFVRNRSFPKNPRTSCDVIQSLGCSWSELESHFESLFYGGMTWENLSEWTIDHIIPLSIAECAEDVLELNHFTNLRPALRIDNQRKHASLPYHLAIALLQHENK